MRARELVVLNLKRGRLDLVPLCALLLAHLRLVAPSTLRTLLRSLAIVVGLVFGVAAEQSLLIFLDALLVNQFPLGAEIT